MSSQELETKIHFGVSTVNFQQASLVETFRKAVLPGLRKQADLSEVEGAITACEKIGDLSLELVYRKWGEEKIKQLLNEKDIPILNVHGPVWWDTLHALKQALQEQDLVLVLADPFLPWLAYGFLKKEFSQSYQLAQDLACPHLTLHPGGASILHQKGLLAEEIKQPIDVLIEPDWRRTRPLAKTWVWQPEKIIEIAQTTGLGITFDTSHQLISQNKLDLCSAFEYYQQKSSGGVKVIHLSGAVLTETGRVHGSLPLDPRLIGEETISHFQEFYQHLVDTDWQGAVIIETASVKMLGQPTLDARIKATETSINVFQGERSNHPSVSLPHQPTSRPF